MPSSGLCKHLCMWNICVHADKHSNTQNKLKSMRKDFHGVRKGIIKEQQSILWEEDKEKTVEHKCRSRNYVHGGRELANGRL